MLPLTSHQKVQRVTVEAQGNLLKLKVDSVPVGGGVRDVIKGFSKASRKRLQELCARLQPGLVWFVTLTYSNPVPAPRTVKRHLAAFKARVRRRWPCGAFIWRFETESKGIRVYHPHLHFMAYNTPGISFWWVLDAWREITEHPDTTQVKVQVVTDWRRVLLYVSKYVAKVSSDAALDYLAYSYGDRWIGRYWGVMNARFLPFAELLSIGVVAGPWFHKVKRAARRYWKGVNGYRDKGFTLFMGNLEQWLGLIEYYAREEYV